MEGKVSPSQAQLSATDITFDHPDSPIRKKPRLDAGDQPDTPMTDEATPQPTSLQNGVSTGPHTPPGDSPCTPDRPVAQNFPPTPSPTKVTTLNLKSPISNSSPVFPCPEPISEFSEDSPEAKNHKIKLHMSSNPPQTRHVVATSDSPSSSTASSVQSATGHRSPYSPDHTVLRIEADDPEDINSDNAGSVVEIFAEPDLGEEIIESFPGYKDRHGTDAARILSLQLDKLDLHVNFIISVTQWMEHWVNYARDLSQRRDAAYLDRPDFWNYIGVIMFKFLRRRVEAGLFAGSRVGHRDEVLCGFFRPYLEICVHLMSIDLEALKTASQPALQSERHVLNLSRILSAEDVSLWAIAEHKYQVDVTEVQHGLTYGFMSADEEFRVLTSLTKELSKIVYARPDVKDMFGSCLAVIVQLGRVLSLNVYQPTDADETLYARYADNALKVVAIASAEFERHLKDQPASFSAEWNKRIIIAVGEIYLSLTKLQVEKAVQLFQIIPGADQELDPLYYPQIDSLDSKLQLVLKMLKGGRLELQVLAVGLLQEMLIFIHNQYSIPKQGQNHPILEHVSKFLLSQQVMERILSVDSHAQIISRSGLVLAFLHLTNCYPVHLTDTIWSLLSTSPDPRIVSATFTMIQSCMNHMRPPVLIALARKFQELPIDAYSHELTILFDLVMEAIGLKMDESSPEMERMAAPMLCLQILQESYGDPRKELHRASIHNAAVVSLQNLGTILLNAPDRQELYGQCKKELELRTTRATGSVEAVYWLLNNHLADDLHGIVQDLDFSRVAVDEFCWYLDSQRRKSESFDRSIGFVPRLQLFKLLCINGPSAALAPLELILWDHLVGEKALDDRARDCGWDALAAIIVKFENHSHPFADRCIKEYFPKTDPKCFTTNASKFLQNANSYCLHSSQTNLQSDSEIITIPLAELMWKLLMTAPDLHVANSANGLLCHHYLDDPRVRNAPKPVVEKTHAALVDRCIHELQQAATKLKLVDQETTTDGARILDATDEPGFREAELSFIHAAEFLRVFLIEVGRRPAFCSPVPDKSSPPTSKKIPKVVGDPFDITFQAFRTGNKMENFRLTIGSMAKLSELHYQILEITKFAKISVILGGQKVNLADNSTETVNSLKDKGNMIVKNIGEDLESTTAYERQPSKSVVERQALQHFDELYALLELEDRYSRFVYELLFSFPPHPSVRTAVISEETQTNEIFPKGRRTKSVYNILALKRHLDSQLMSGVTDETFIRRSVTVISQELIRNDVKQICGDHPFYLVSVIECLLAFLKEHPEQSHDFPYFSAPRDLVESLLQVLGTAQHISTSSLYQLTCSTYTTLLEASLHDLEVWKCLTGEHPKFQELQRWLILEHPSEPVRRHIQTVIEGLCEEIPMQVAVGRQQFAAYYWLLLKSFIPESSSYAAQSEQLLSTAASVLRIHSSYDADEPALRSYVDEWGSFLVRLADLEATPVAENDTDPYLFGITKLLSTCVFILKSLNKPLNAGWLLNDIFHKLLFPAIHTDPSSSFDIVLLPIKILDSTTRKELYDLVINLCEDVETLDKMVNFLYHSLLDNLNSKENSWNCDRSLWVRSRAGYVGLRNLHNTCYINSLVVQLYMNCDFRNFILDTSSFQSSDPRKLLAETRRLFVNLLNSTEKFTDPSDFVDSIEPYEGDQINISQQMDVDEFYNLLFERWENQMPSADMQSRLRSFFGGELVTQIKSMECEHISETPESFLAIQCEIKGKRTLAESLNAYVEGDVMEGNNKYKCESCGGKFVNAVKRSCLKRVPDSLVFHLKRFEFDVVSHIRMKINDSFDFPDKIDMAPYTADHLTQTDEEQSKEDIFVLTGVIIHIGEIDGGHYYSLIRIGGPEATGHGSWAEFNDRDVTLIDPADIPNMAFGGPQMSTDGSRLNKSWSAYMLFYKRASTLAANQMAIATIPTQDQQSAELPIMNSVIQENRSRMLRYCLFDPTCGHFMRSLLIRLNALQAGTCSDGHDSKQATLNMLLVYLDQVACRVKDCPGFAEAIAAIQKVSMNCEACGMLIFDWINDNHPGARNLLLSCPHIRVRSAFANMIFTTLQYLRSNAEELYGEDVESLDVRPGPVDLGGAFEMTMGFLKAQIGTLGSVAHNWTNYFLLLNDMASLGCNEILCLANNGIFKTCLQLLLLEYSDISRRDHLLTYEYMRKSYRKFFPYAALTRLALTFLKQAAIFGKDAESRSDRLHDEDLADSENRWTFLLTSSEKALLECWDSNNKQLCFVGKVLESWDDTTSDQVPCAVIKAFLDNAPPQVFVKRLAFTLKSGILNYQPSYLVTYLHASVQFAESCENASKVLDVIEAVADSARDIENKSERRHVPLYFKAWKLSFDTDWMLPQGGWDHVTALSNFSRLKALDEAGRDIPLELEVIRLAPRWAPELLMYDGEGQDQVRVAVRSLLDDLLFSKFPDTPPDGQKMPEKAITITTGVYILFLACIECVEGATGATIPKHVVKDVAAVGTQCFNFMRHLNLMQEPVWDELKGLVDMGKLNQWVKEEKALATLPDERDAPMEGCETEDDEESWGTEDEALGRIERAAVGLGSPF